MRILLILIVILSCAVIAPVKAHADAPPIFCAGAGCGYADPSTADVSWDNLVTPDMPLTCAYGDGETAPWCGFYSPTEYQPGRNGWKWGGEWHTYVPLSEDDAVSNDMNIVCQAGVLKGGYVTHGGVLWKDCTDGPGWLAPFFDDKGQPVPTGSLRWKGVSSRQMCFDPNGLPDIYQGLIELYTIKSIDAWNAESRDFKFQFAGRCPGAERYNTEYSVIGRKVETTTVNPNVLGYAEFLSLLDTMVTCDISFPANKFWEFSMAQTVLHEIGHCYGLEHSSENKNEPDPYLHNAVMYFAQWFGSPSQLTPWDIEAIQKRYGKP